MIRGGSNAELKTWLECCCLLSLPFFNSELKRCLEIPPCSLVIIAILNDELITFELRGAPERWGRRHTCMQELKSGVSTAAEDDMNSHI